MSDRIERDRDWGDYPVGTRAYSKHGGWWLRVADGWQWAGGSRFAGSTVPTPGRNAVGACIRLPASSATDLICEAFRQWFRRIGNAHDAG